MRHFQNKEVITGWICVKCSVQAHIQKVNRVKEEMIKV